MGSKEILMVYPNGFRVEYVINPHMADENGLPKKVDFLKALSQWEKLKKVFESLNQKVHVIEGDSKYPDMVFCANQTFPFINESGEKSILLSNMYSEHRKPEVKHFESWAKKNNYKVYKLKTDKDFEGCGDLIHHFETKKYFGGYGFRTQKSVYKEIEKIINSEILTLELINGDFYHLDTCFVILDGQTAAFVPEAFSNDSIDKIKRSFKKLIRIDLNEAKKYFAGNAFSLDNKNIILQRGATKFISELKSNGFIIHEVETGEFIKSGGSVFCMKQVL